MTRVASAFGQRQALERNFGQHAQGSERTGHEARNVEPRDVLDHLPAERKRFAGAVDDARAEHEIANGTGVRPAGSGEAGCHDTAERRAGSMMRRLEGEELVALRERILDFRKRRAGQCSDDQFAGRVGDDPGQFTNIERFACGGLAVEVLRPATADAERLAVGRRSTDAILQRRGRRTLHGCRTAAILSR